MKLKAHYDNHSKNWVKIVDIVAKVDSKPENAHRHDNYQVFLFLSGEGRHLLDLNWVSYGKRGQVHIVPKGNMHCLRREKSGRAFVLLFFEEAMEEFFNSDSHIKQNIVHQLSQVQNFKLAEDQIEQVKTLFEIALHSYTAKAPVTQLVSLAESLLLLLFKNRVELDTKNDNQQIYFRFIQLLRKKFMKEHSVDFYCECLNVSNKKLGSVTKGVISKTPKRIISEYILKAVKRDLTVTNFNLDQIAYRNGFYDSAHMYNMFKRLEKTSPAKWRKFHKGNAENFTMMEETSVL